MDLPSPKVCRRIRQLFALIGSFNDNEANRARERLNKLLADQKLSWNDLPAIVAAADADEVARKHPQPANTRRSADTSAGTRPAVNDSISCCV